MQKRRGNRAIVSLPPDVQPVAGTDDQDVLCHAIPIPSRRDPPIPAAASDMLDDVTKIRSRGPGRDLIGSGTSACGKVPFLHYICGREVRQLSTLSNSPLIILPPFLEPVISF